MTPEQYRHVTELFLKAVELAPEQRESFLDDACGQDAEIRSEVQSLLAHDSSRTMIDRPEGEQTSPPTVRVAPKVKRSRGWQRAAKLTQYIGPRGQFALGACAAIAILVLLAGIAEWSIATFQRSLRSAALQEILDAKVAGLEMWIESEQEKISSWARSTELQGLIAQLVELADNEQTSAEDLRESPLQEKLREVIFRIANEKVSYQLWDLNHSTLADEPGRTGIGSGVTSIGASVLTKVFDGQSHLMTFDRNRHISDVPTAMHVEPHSGTLTPVRDAAGNVIAALLVIDHDANAHIAKIFRLADLGTSGETYAFNQDGVLLTESRFDDQLRKVGLIPDSVDTRSARAIYLRDPGGDLTKGFRPEEPLAVRPLTKMAQYATAGIDDVDVNGYRDYRGVMVSTLR